MSSRNASAPTNRKPTALGEGVEYWQQLVREQQQTIEKLRLINLAFSALLRRGCHGCRWLCVFECRVVVV